MTSLWGELRRRNVVRVAIAYAVATWLLIQISATAFPMLNLPAWSGTLVTVLLLIGFPVALIFAWAFELTPEGLKKEKDVDRSESITRVTGRKLDSVIIAVLAVAVVFLVADKFYLSEADAPRGEMAAGERKSIAVLPFVNMSDDPNNEYFSDGISEEILNLLAKVSELQVTSRSSAFSFKGQNVDVPTIAARLNVAHVLEGSVRKSGDQLRITAQLIDVDTDAHLWSETYDRELKNVFAIQDEIAAAVADAMQITLLGKRPKATETDPEAYALYLQGQHFFRQGSTDGIQQAEILLKQALAIDSAFAPAWVSLGETYFFQAALYSIRDYDEGIELARHAAQQALEIDSQNARAYASLAQIEFAHDWDFVSASQHIQQALALNPGDANTVISASRLDLTMGRAQEGIKLARQATVLDPISGHYMLGLALYFARRQEEAADSLRLAVSLSPDGVRNRYMLSLTLVEQGNASAALEAINREPDDGWRLAGMAVVQHALGKSAASDAALEELIDRFAGDSAYQVAAAYAFRGEIDLAFNWLERAYDNRDGGLNALLLDPLLASLHDDPRWEPFVDKMGLPH